MSNPDWKKDEKETKQLLLLSRDPHPEQHFAGWKEGKAPRNQLVFRESSVPVNKQALLVTDYNLSLYAALVLPQFAFAMHWSYMKRRKLPLSFSEKAHFSMRIKTN